MRKLFPRLHTLATVTFFAVATAIVAVAAVFVVVGDIYTIAKTDFFPFVTLKLTLAVDTFFVWSAGSSTATAIFLIDAQVNALIATDGCPFWTIAFASSIGADLSVCARVIAFSTVLDTRACVDALSVALYLASSTILDAFVGSFITDKSSWASSTWLRFATTYHQKGKEKTRER